MCRRKTIIYILLTVMLPILLGTSTGCNGVRRRLTITSEPPGALVYLNDQEIGKTPVSHNITYSGTYKIRCTKDSFETKTVMHRVGTPWYLYPGIDFFSENFVAGEIRDLQSCHIVLNQQREIPGNELLEEANKMRTQAHNAASQTPGAVPVTRTQAPAYQP